MVKKMFALTDAGTKALYKGIGWNLLTNLALMAPVVLVLLVLEQLLSPLFGVPASSLSLGMVIGVGAVLLLVLYGTNYQEYRATYVSAYEQSADRRIRLAEKLRVLPLSFFGQRDLSDLTTTLMADCTALEHTFSHAIPQLFGSIISVLLVSIGLASLDGPMALAVFAPLPLSLLVVFGSRRMQVRLGKDKIVASLSATEGIQECLETIKDLKSCGEEIRYLQGLEKKFDTVVKESLRSETYIGVFISSASIILKFGLVATIYLGAVRFVSGELSFTTYLVFLLAASRLYDPLVTVMMQLAEVFQAQLQIGRAKEIDDHPVQQGSSLCSVQGYDVRFEHVTFAYGNDAVLKGVSFEAKQGEVTAFIGPSGGGKSTAAKLAARFWDPDEGKITLGGVDVTSVDPEVLLQNFSIVFQDVVLFHGTVRENIRLGKRGASDEEVEQAARLAQCESFIMQLAHGYDTVLGENGSTLSGGERQRLSIARALLKDAPVILLDEATASLDVENETLIQQALSTLIKNKTVVVIAHRLRTIAHSDHLVVFDQGQVKESGSPQELEFQQGMYTSMVKLQHQASSWSL